MKYHKRFWNPSLVFSILLYLCGFILFWEWLRPLEFISDTGNITMFIVYAVFCFFLSTLKVKWWISSPLKIIGMLFIIDGLFLQQTIGTQQWFKDFVFQIQYNAEMIGDHQWYQLTPFFRSLLFLILLWLMSYLLYYWFVVVKRVSLFIILTFIYLTVLDTFTVYQADASIVRTFIISMFALAISGFSNQMEKESVRPHYGKWFGSILIPVLILLPLVTLLGYSAPKFDPKWPDPVPFLTSTAENAGFGEGGNSSLQKVGYGEDDSQLGGSFIQDDTLVFEARVERSHYWRIESKDRYTGKGWERSTDLDYQAQTNGNIDLALFSDEVETRELNGTIQYTDEVNFSKVVYPYGIEKVSGADQVSYLLDQQTGIIEAEGPEQQGVLATHDIVYQYPSFSLNLLENAGDNDPNHITDLYLQLPNELPNRVVDLAESITMDDETRYDKAKSVERYFSQNGFDYQTEDVAIPGRNDDYVDQFLFETQIGYCDNFSTSMVVLLRSLDIPTRWVKGFTGGQIANDQVITSNTENTYQVTNGNAHSWVEVYFPDVGWVPFEPTIGFSNTVDFYQETNTDQDNDTETEETATEDEEEEQVEEEQAQEIDEKEETVGSSATQNDRWYFPVIVVIVLMILVSLAIFTRYRWLSFIYVRRYNTFKDQQSLDKAYHFLLRVLQHKGINKTKQQTLREYARDVDAYFETKQMSELTNFYERALYRNEQDLKNNVKMQELWENVLKRLWS
ncbi:MULTISPECIES: transglutaminase domain-containing protein [Paraliobacillus]|uniref:DUF4129 domain-containing transglutaminase family protein n=1 Tax=Paraliobacillus TaxID=200903 RepID=UPI000DD42BAE|nr:MULTISPECIES: transglutaminase domain-containing protein [Paraliobacillus]